jgi:hypothetical protein
MLASLVLAGVLPVRKVIQIAEARTELKVASPSLFRRLRGWSFIVLWALVTGYSGSFIGDWIKAGDLDGAIDRTLSRLRIVVEILVVIMASDQ